jgi:predicted ATP-grasp superfamily ATP-dependent carboligase
MTGEARFSYTVPPAVVVGACGHGLALVRGLHAERVPTLVLEANLQQAGSRTRLATLVPTPDINGPALIDALLALRARIDCPDRPVLLLTNDTMVRTVGQHWPRLEQAYRLSWGPARESLLPLLEKSALEARCAATGLLYPKTFVLHSAADIDAALQELALPIIVKPARPLSRFKTSQPADRQQLAELVQRFEGDLPFLVQQFIPGDDTSIFFSALYLDQGRELARFDGHKLRSRPLGHTSIAEPFRDDEVHAQTQRFFAGLQLSGPVSLELKRDPQGRLWVIEPTVGRTDFWVGLCTVNGVNLPAVEYAQQAGRPLPVLSQRDERFWFNEDRDPFGPMWLRWRSGVAMRGRSRSHLYLHADDPGPALAFLRRFCRDAAAAIGRRLRRLIGL